MDQPGEPILFLYDAAQQLKGVLVSPEFWERIKDQVCALLPARRRPRSRSRPSPSPTGRRSPPTGTSATRWAAT
jgi:hypothetical protein